MSKACSFVGKCMLRATTFLGFLVFYVSDNFIVLLLTISVSLCFLFSPRTFEGKTRKTINVNSLPRRFFEPFMTKLWKCRYRETEIPRNVVALNIHFLTKLPAKMYFFYLMRYLSTDIVSSDIFLSMRLSMPYLESNLLLHHLGLSRPTGCPA